MATVYVGSARSDENGKAYGGKAGDQKSGKEVSTQAWYKHSKGWRVFRAKDAKKAGIIGEQMIAACNNNKIGYDQWERYDLFAEAKKVGFDLAKVSVATECDCSELVRCCCAAAGIMDLPTSGFRTGNMPKNLLATGEFVELKGSKYTDKSDFLGFGDILVTSSSGHTVVVISNGEKYEGTVEEKELVFGEDVLRKGDEGPAVKLMQEYLKELGYDLGTYGTDGDFGPDTEDALRAFQEKHGLEVDGEYGPESHEAMMKALAKVVRISGGDCWIRAEPNTGGAKLGVAKDGDELPYGGVTAENGWLQVKSAVGTGFVSGRYGGVE